MSAATSIALERIMPPRLGSVDPSTFPDEEFDLYSIPAFDQGKPEVLQGSAIGSAKQIVQPADVLLSRIVPHIRRAWVVGDDRGRRIIASGEWIVFRGENIEPRYLRHVLVGDSFHAEFMRTVSGVGGSLLRARPAYVAKIKIPLPSLPEQRRIAAILDKADELRAKRRAALAQLDRLTQSIFLDMFGDPIRNDRDWPIKPVGHFVAGFETGKNLVANDEDDDSTELRVLKVSAVTSLRFRPEESKPLPSDYVPPPSHFVRKDDLLFSRANTQELIGATALVKHAPEGLVLPDKLWRFTWHDEPRADPHFVHWLFRQPRFRFELGRRATGTSGSMKNISQEKVLDIKVALPGLLLQRKFGRIAYAIDRLRQTGEEALSTTNTAFISLQHRAFRGEL